MNKDTCSLSLKLIGLSSGAGLIVVRQLIYPENHVYCEAKLKTRIVDESQTQPKFDWKKFWLLLKPHWMYLVVAITVYLLNTFWCNNLT